jgi:hypothetical protein
MYTAAKLIIFSEVFFSKRNIFTSSFYNAPFRKKRIRQSDREGHTQGQVNTDRQVDGWTNATGD